MEKLLAPATLRLVTASVALPHDGTSECITELQRYLGVPRRIVHRWARAMHLTGSKGANWTKDEIAYLEKHFNTKRPEEVADYLGRTTLAVKAKAHQLGMDIPDGYSLDEVRQGLGRSWETANKWVKCGMIKGTRCAFNATTWNFTDAQIRDFIIAHPEEIDLRRVEKLWFIDILACRDGIGCLDNPHNR
jgi:hypothetical protein